MNTQRIIPLVAVVAVFASSACATFVRRPVYEPVEVVRPAPVVVERDEPVVYERASSVVYPRVYHDSTVIYREPSVVTVHARGRPATTVVVNRDAGHYGRGERVSHHGSVVVVADHKGGHDNGRGNGGHNNGHGNAGTHGHSRSR